MKQENDGLLNYIIGSGFPRIVSDPQNIISRSTGQCVNISFEDVCELYKYATHGESIWVFNSNLAFYMQEFTIAVGTEGIPIYRLKGENGFDYDTFFGLPLFFSDRLNAPGKRGDVILLNIKKYFNGDKCVVMLEDLE